MERAWPQGAGLGRRWVGGEMDRMDRIKAVRSKSVGWSRVSVIIIRRVGQLAAGQAGPEIGCRMP